ncbi:phytanoyl-CoA dioxygenase [Candidatus Poribacteria bacterium]|nr:phytanoyl-CoA dioxygenase [Candidatus Poribacteria bacterium]
MTHEQKFLFDLKGYVLKPGVLAPDLVGELKEYCQKLRRDRDSLPPHERALPGGPAAELIDHPEVMDIVSDVLEHRRERVRLESAFFSHRTLNDDAKVFPHGGVRTVYPNYNYNYHDGQIYSGMLRVVFELEPVREWQGGTVFMAGSHKANTWPVPEGLDELRPPYYETYSCPPGSILAFAEACRHSRAPWTNEDNDRLAIFYAYNHVCVRHHHPNSISQEVVDGLPKDKQSFFHEVYHPQFDSRNV